MQARGAWTNAHAEAIIDIGSPLGRTKQVSAGGIADIGNALTAGTVVRAESHAQAA